MHTLFSWIHISDLHFGHGDTSHGWDQLMVLECLRRDAGNLGHLAPSAIFVTGDISFSGNSRINPGEESSREYASAKRWLDSLATTTGLSNKDIFLVPGNHDVERSADGDRATARLVRSIRDGHEQLDEALADANEKALLTRRFRNYSEFAKSFAPAILQTHSDPAFTWSHRHQVTENLRLRLIGLNTALLAADNFDLGHLWLGKKALSTIINPPVERNELVILMSHHPLHGGWLADEKEVNAWVSNHAHILLSGHVHEAESQEIRAGGGGSLVKVTAGASHGERNAPGVPAGHGYNFAALVVSDKGDLSLRVWPRVWSDKNKRFRADLDNTIDGQEYAEHKLRINPLNPDEKPSNRSTSSTWKTESPPRETISGISDAAQKILHEQPDLWEVRFFSQVLADGLNGNADLRRDWVYGVPGEPTERHDLARTLRLIQAQTQYLLMLIQGATGLINEALPQAMREPGVPGDAKELAYVASRLADGHRKAIEWALRFRRLSVDNELRPLVNSVASLSETSICGIERFSADLQKNMQEFFGQGSYKGPPRTVEITLTFEPPDTTTYEQELKRVRRQYKL